MSSFQWSDIKCNPIGNFSLLIPIGMLIAGFPMKFAKNTYFIASVILFTSFLPYKNSPLLISEAVIVVGVIITSTFLYKLLNYLLAQPFNLLLAINSKAENVLPTPKPNIVGISRYSLL